MTNSTALRARSLWIIAIAAVLAIGLAIWAVSASIAGSTANDPQSAPTSDESAPAAGAVPAGVLPADTRLGTTRLVVGDLEPMLAFYEGALGMTMHSQDSDSMVLGWDEPVLELVRSDDPAPDVADAGLYHTAFLFADEASLAGVLAQVAQNAPESYQGSADHAVSLAFYFGDPEGNGVELYVDRPRDEWAWVDGMVQMGSAALDPNQFMQEHLGAEAAGTATIGHMHLKVGDLATARAFYADTLGFDVVAEADGALFYSAGGYHHHIATNVWQSADAGPRQTPRGLGHLSVVLPSPDDVAVVQARLDGAGHQYEIIDAGIVAEDPWGNAVRITS